MSFRKKSTEELIGGGSWIATGFAMLDQYNSIMDGIANREYRKEARRQEKENYKIGVVDTIGGSLNKAIERGDREQIKVLSNQLTEYTKRIPDTGDANTRAVVSTYLSTANDAVKDVKILDDFDDKIDKYTKKGGLFSYDHFAKFTGKEFNEKIQESLDEVKGMRRELRNAGISNLKAYETILDQEVANIHKIKQVAGHNLDLPVEENAWERGFILNAKLGDGVTTPAQQFKALKTERDGIEDKVVAYDSNIVELKGDLEALMLDDSAVTDQDVADHQAKISIAESQIKLLQEERTKLGARLDEYDEVLTNDRSLDWYGIGKPKISLENLNDGSTDDDDKSDIKNSLNQISGILDKKDGFVTDLDVVVKENDEGDLWMFTKDGQPYDSADIANVAEDLANDYGDYKAKQEEAAAKIPKINEDVQDVAKKYKFSINLPDKQSPTVVNKSFKELKALDTKYEEAVKYETEVRNALAEVAQLKETREKLKEQMKLSKGSDALSSVINETNSRIKALEKKYGTVKYGTSQSRFSIIPIPTQNITLNNATYEKAQKKVLIQKTALENFVETLKQIY